MKYFGEASIKTSASMVTRLVSGLESYPGSNQNGFDPCNGSHTASWYGVESRLWINAFDPLTPRIPWSGDFIVSRLL